MSDATLFNDWCQALYGSAMDDTKRGDASDPYEIIITAQDQPQRSGYFSGNKHTQPMTYVRMNLPERHIRRIDRAAASINVNRQDIVRAIIRQALDSGPAEIVTGWGRSERV